MAGFDDLISPSSPALVGDGAQWDVTEGMTWGKTLYLADGNGDPIPWDGVTGTCLVWERATFITNIPVFLAEAGVLVLLKEAGETGGLASGVRGGRRCTWGLSLAKGTAQVAVWTPDNSFITIHNATGV